MTSSPRSGLAVLALAGMAALTLAAGRAPAAPRSAERASVARRAAVRDTGRTLAPQVPERPAYFDSTRGDSFAEPQLFMAWRAPYGTPGAQANLDMDCSDTSRVDTLYLSFETGRDLPEFVGMSAKLLFHPAEGDSLGPFWSFGREGANPGALMIQLDPDGTFPCSQPWVRPGLGAPGFEFNPWLGQLTFVYAVSLDDVAPISGRTRYCYARVLLHRRHCRLAGLRQPVCVEWAEAFYSGGGNDIPIQRGPARFVTVNSPDGSVCAAYRRVVRPSTWRPIRPARGGVSPARGGPPADSTGR
jgi:hypothetical protein